MNCGTSDPDAVILRRSRPGARGGCIMAENAARGTNRQVLFSARLLAGRAILNVLGFSGIANGAFYRQKYGLEFVGHDSSVALVVDGKVVFAVEEERVSREKHTSLFPVHAFSAALEFAGLKVTDLDRVAYTWHVSPPRLAHMFAHHAFRVPFRHWFELALAGSRVIRDMMSPRRIARQFAEALGCRLPPCDGVSHHLGHSACAYFTSPFDHAAVLTIDGQGEDESGSLGEWQGTEYRHFRSIYSPDSIGILYGMVTDFLGMRAAWDEYKVMGMSAYGDPSRFSPALEKLVSLGPDGRYSTKRTAMVFKPGYCDRMLAGILGIRKRDRQDPLEQVHFNVAAALQQTTEAVVFHLLRHLRRSSRAANLCLAGGVFLNSVINGKIRQSGMFEDIHIPPVPGDHGGALARPCWSIIADQAPLATLSASPRSAGKDTRKPRWSAPWKRPGRQSSSRDASASRKRLPRLWRRGRSLDGFRDGWSTVRGRSDIEAFSLIRRSQG